MSDLAFIQSTLEALEIQYTSIITAKTSVINQIATLDTDGQDIPTSTTVGGVLSTSVSIVDLNRRLETLSNLENSLRQNIRDWKIMEAQNGPGIYKSNSGEWC